MSEGDADEPVKIKRHMNQFERVDKITFYAFVVGFAVWVLNYPEAAGADIFWMTIVPMILVAFAASRRWSALLSSGPAAPVES